MHCFQLCLHQLLTRLRLSAREIRRFEEQQRRRGLEPDYLANDFAAELGRLEQFERSAMIVARATVCSKSAQELAGSIADIRFDQQRQNHCY